MEAWVMSLFFMKINLQEEHISIWMVSHEDYFRQQGKRQPGSGLFDHHANFQF